MTVSADIPDTPPSADGPAELYRRLRDRYETEAAELRRLSRRLSGGRLGSFFAGVACLAPALVGTPTPRLPWLGAAGALFALLIVLVVWDGRLRRRIRSLETLRDVNARSLARHAVDLPLLAPCPPVGELLGPGEEPPAHVRDLYLFGHASLFRLTSTAHTPAGRRVLARWLAEGADPDEVARRQAAVRTLAEHLAFRQEVEALATRVAEEAPRPADLAALERFYAWAEDEPLFGPRSVRLWVARMLTLAIPAGLVGMVTGTVPWSVWLLVALGGYLMSALSAETMHEVFDRATAGGDGLRGYGPLLRALENLPESDDEDCLLGELAARLRPEGRSGPVWAGRWMDRLDKLTVLSDTRRGLIYFFVQVLTLWDFHLIARFEVWQREAGPSVRGWLETLGEVEALASLAALAHAQPDWAWPRVGVVGDAADSPGDGDGDGDGTPRTPASVTARDLGHPLIPPERRVGNDVEVGPPGSFLLVTGSNMSGKTTLLRAIGANAVLAQAGGPVCAAELTMPAVRLATSVVVEDSLEEGVSFFMAELLRLKAVVDAAAETAGHGDPILLFLLDEILRGTNSTERRVAVQRVLRRLIDLGAIGAITSHDLEITTGAGADLELARAAVPIHFRETIRPKPEGGAEMTFDYMARSGLAPTTNALRLLEAVGLGEAEPVDSEPGEGPR